MSVIGCFNNRCYRTSRCLQEDPWPAHATKSSAGPTKAHSSAPRTANALLYRLLQQDNMSVPISPVAHPEGVPVAQMQSPPPPGTGAGGLSLRQSLRVMDISRKRRSGSCESVPAGRPFINPVDRVNRERPRRSFFRDVQETDARDALRQTIDVVQSLTQAQAFRIALSLHLSPPTQAKLQEFVANIAEQDEDMIETVNRAINGVVRARTETAARPAGLEFFDYRYRPAGREDKCFKMGDVPLDFHFQVPESQYHVVLQCFADVAPPVFRWPWSLRMFVNGHPVKPIGRFAFPLIDLTEFGVGADVRIVYDVDGGKYLLMLREATFESFGDLVAKIENERAIDDPFNDLDASVFSPMSGKILKHPGRGRGCRHAQCFDLKELLKISTATQMWVCPICRLPTHPGDLVSSTKMRRLLYELKPVAPVLPQVEEVPPMSEPQSVNVIDDRGDGVLGWQLFDGKNDEDDDDWQFAL